ncbi:tco89p [Saccharomyces arboricola H-6]|uniref:Tco89p n=1 Tax=Saccharomyces arboricola (strain H-6 / AS 2.3317 / CBS 10644) TaxID=1160507 RepID=J8PVS6_SACAR|nr:tco89p [Saccharomyces arboricola H-6]
MVHRGRTLKPGTDISSPNTSTVSHQSKPFRQFSTRSRAKSNASFKGLRRVLTHDGTLDSDYFSKHNISQKCKSSDSLFRKRTISGLNMTALTRVKSNQGKRSASFHSPVHNTLLSPKSSSHSNSTNSGYGLKPRRSKSTQSVLSLRDAQESDESGSTTDEEVECFSEDDTDNVDINSDKIGIKPLTPDRKGSIPHSTDNKLQSPEPIDEQEEDKALNNKKENYRAVSLPLPHLTSNDYFRESSHSTECQNDGNTSSSSIETKLNENGIINEEEQSNTTRETGADAESENSQKLKCPLIRKDDNVPPHAPYIANEEKILDIGNTLAAHKSNQKQNHTDEPFDREDHIDTPRSNSSRKSDASFMSLRRQGSKQHKLLNEDEDLIKPGNIISSIDSNVKDMEGHNLLENYAPDMILSQSTGVERRFENSSSIQNSLGKEIHKPGERMDSDNTFNDMNDDKLPNGTKDARQTKPGQNIPNSQSIFPASTNINIKDNNVPQHSFSTSISSLTNNLRRAVPESFHGSSRINNIFHKKSNQNLLLRSNDAGRNSLTPNSPLSNEHSTSNTNFSGNANDQSNSGAKFNSFAQFLKSDGIDAESRTQRKLWLQRENSIMDLSSQNDGSDSIFMAGNIDAKREFERISHEYSNVKRFYNPLDEALLRIEPTMTGNANNIRKKNHNDGQSIAQSNGTPDHKEEDDSIFANYDKKFDDLYPHLANAKIQAVLCNIWKNESYLFNKDVNPINKNRTPSTSHSTSHNASQSTRNLLRGPMGSSTTLHHQRVVNSLQPTTRAVNRRMENVGYMHTQPQQR